MNISPTAPPTIGGYPTMHHPYQASHLYNQYQYIPNYQSAPPPPQSMQYVPPPPPPSHVNNHYTNTNTTNTTKPKAHHLRQQQQQQQYHMPNISNNNNNNINNTSSKHYVSKNKQQYHHHNNNNNINNVEGDLNNTTHNNSSTNNNNTPILPPPSSYYNGFVNINNNKKKFNNNNSNRKRSVSDSTSIISPVKAKSLETEPAFYKAVDRAMPELMKEYLGSNCVFSESNNNQPTIYTVLKEYLKDFSVHREEKSKLEYRDQKTRWQEMAEKLFTFTLKLSEFDITVHKPKLLELLNRAKKFHEIELEGIINNYLSILL
ncbi:hypothetical protein CYY_001016 [Polysphondylium violaceum]|uniref:Uncharacterized protein n=1 Tax=Polysphondylium violaceum TaxID=133409 RepID=A0A8J4VB04_9MYCE|nr:hypothetical protein CYY_001016 [Polysphondylium violaceum]